MKLVTIPVFKCEYCGKTGNEINVSICEKSCKLKREEQQRRDEEYRKKVEAWEERNMAKARENMALKLLVENGFLEEAHLICEDLTRLDWDCGSSWQVESLHKKMVGVWQ